MTTPENHALENARKSLANDLELEMKLLTGSWTTLGLVFEVLELDFELKGEELEFAWNAIASSWRDIISDHDLSNEQISAIWFSILSDLQSFGPDAIELISTLDATKLIQNSLFKTLK